ncbi:hypothetical protein NST74_06985 [Paenibacillus sp. FSL F4-0125]|uniref:hypothetical protein n=1 Tax=Paenibacillus sp. FSL F4-0125 TaxID=2954730 RepID=UPI0030F6CDC4
MAFSTKIEECYGVGTTKLLGYFEMISDPYIWDSTSRWSWYLRDGIHVLFTSKPELREQYIDACRVFEALTADRLL